MNAQSPIPAKPRLSPEQIEREALAYRIWAHCEPLGWDCTFRGCAAALGESTDRVRRIAQTKGWLGRFRRTSCDWGDGNAPGLSVTKPHEVAELPPARPDLDGDDAYLWGR